MAIRPEAVVASGPFNIAPLAGTALVRWIPYTTGSGYTMELFNSIGSWTGDGTLVSGSAAWTENDKVMNIAAGAGVQKTSTTTSGIFATGTANNFALEFVVDLQAMATGAKFEIHVNTTTNKFSMRITNNRMYIYDSGSGGWTKVYDNPPAHPPGQPAPTALGAEIYKFRFCIYDAGGGTHMCQAYWDTYDSSWGILFTMTLGGSGFPMYCTQAPDAADGMCTLTLDNRTGAGTPEVNIDQIKCKAAVGVAMPLRPDQGVLGDEAFTRYEYHASTDPAFVPIPADPTTLKGSTTDQAATSATVTSLTTGVPNYVRIMVVANGVTADNSSSGSVMVVLPQPMYSWLFSKVRGIAKKYLYMLSKVVVESQNPAWVFARVVMGGAQNSWMFSSVKGFATKHSWIFTRIVQSFKDYAYLFGRVVSSSAAYSWLFAMIKQLTPIWLWGRIVALETSYSWLWAKPSRYGVKYACLFVMTTSTPEWQAHQYDLAVKQNASLQWSQQLHGDIN